jgi:SAM-dependent methyltransferase
VAREFLAWLAVPPGGHWLDVGCGTGALTQTILAQAAPAAVLGVDASAGFVAYAQAHTPDPRASFAIEDAQALTAADGSFDAAVSGLVLNFIPQPERAAAAMARATRPGGTVAAYVWDYAGQMQFMRYFWDAAVALDPAEAMDEGARFPLCQPDPLAALWRQAGLHEVAVRAIDIPTVFRDFDDYWAPFLGGQGAAPSYAMRLSEARRAALRDHLRAALPVAAGGSISLFARAWAVRGWR